MSYQYDHRQLADEMELYFFNDQIGAGLPVWLPNGVAIRDELEAWMKELERREGYVRVVSPHIAKSDLYQQSGHLHSFQENMFPPMKCSEDGNHYYLKPMNCPHHHQVFASQLRSYREMPVRIAEYGQVYRYENSGSLRGLSRVRGLCQNDAHLYVDPENAVEEIGRVLDLHEHCYSVLGLKGYRYRLSLHDPKLKAQYDGSSESWSEGESILRKCLLDRNLPFFEAVGEAAFYGPKIDVQMKLGQGAEESIASVQLDFNGAEKFDLSFISRVGKKVKPWIIHRAPLGSHERFVALLLEYYDGRLPGWLCPVQVYLLPVDENHIEVADRLAQKLFSNGIRAQVDRNAGSLSKRLKFAHKLRPFSKVVIGPKEISSLAYSLELRDQKIQGDEDQLLSELEKRCRR